MDEPAGARHAQGGERMPEAPLTCAFGLVAIGVGNAGEKPCQYQDRIKRIHDFMGDPLQTTCSYEEWTEQNVMPTAIVGNRVELMERIMADRLEADKRFRDLLNMLPPTVLLKHQSEVGKQGNKWQASAQNGSGYDEIGRMLTRLRRELAEKNDGADGAQTQQQPVENPADQPVVWFRRSSDFGLHYLSPVYGGSASPEIAYHAFKFRTESPMRRFLDQFRSEIDDNGGDGEQALPVLKKYYCVVFGGNAPPRSEVTKPLEIDEEEVGVSGRVYGRYAAAECLARLMASRRQAPNPNHKRKIRTTTNRRKKIKTSSSTKEAAANTQT